MKVVDVVIIMLAGMVCWILIATTLPAILHKTPLTDLKAMMVNGLVDSAIAIIAFYVGTKSKL